MTVSEEARRIDCIKYLLGKNYPTTNFECETVVIKWVGNERRNSLRADIVIYDIPIADANDLPPSERNKHIILIAEIKRESKSKKSAVNFQLEPALRQIDRPSVFGVYWDDINRHLYVKKTVNNEVSITKDELGNIPDFGNQYQYKKLKYLDLIQPEDISATLMDIANTLRSNHINDDSVRYRETVKLLLAKYIDEREAKETGNDLILQVVPGTDVTFASRIEALYKRTARIYSKAKSVFAKDTTGLDEKVLREIIEKVQGLNLLDSSSDSMQQVFMTFVPVVFKKDLDQYFTPLTLVNCMVEILRPGPNDKVVDPAMGTADFLTAALQYRLKRNDGQIVNRVYGADKDKQAYELAVINMILNKDGQTNLHNVDSIENFSLWEGQMDVALCNPPFGSRTIETRQAILKNYDLGHEWKRKEGRWQRTGTVLDSQQLGILFIERCFKLLAEGGRMGIILPEGYLCTASYGYVRQWVIDNFKIIGLVELPRRIFLKSEADLRSNILFAEKLVPENNDYAVHSELVRKVGYKLGKGFFSIPLRDGETGLEMRDEMNRVMIDTDFRRVKNNFLMFLSQRDSSAASSWTGARLRDISTHPLLDMKPRRINFKALSNIRTIKNGSYVRLEDAAEVVEETVEFKSVHKENELLHLIEGQDIRAVEGVVILKDREKRWQIEVRKTSKGYLVMQRDIVIGLVRPERRNIGFYIHADKHVYASTDGVAIVRERPENKNRFPIEWVFHALRTEMCRIQFWTESGGTSYGKLTLDQIKNVLIPVPARAEIQTIKSAVVEWSRSISDSSIKFHHLWSPHDKVAILNSPLIGLESDQICLNSEADED
ncbi:N-6 DNA methylase [Nitrosovibrio tenuis]|uniref:Type I restriction enzyme M protein n=1 Tax=Nitrosovibrio tenuis TaxID=1233 RepID=A0A1H7MAW7_9PROT|nr:N-6 DNA methylase [Nitrosovibrio tenuis]SEL08333.1 type I restriction enzyme M protein [Nitrosovibrio tenuis]